MGLFHKAESTSAFAKIGMMGFAGSGKTYTASQFAVGLHKLQKSTKPVFFLDTETGSDWVMPIFKSSGVPLSVAKTRAFVDLLTAVEEATKEGSVLIVDSVTHFWTELTESYAKKKNRTRGLEFQDWAYLKKEWGKFTTAFINAPLHIIICGRAGYEYDYFENDSGKKELEKTGVKMKAEGEFGFEPSLLILMERYQTKDMKVVRTATILKDRSTRLDGMTFDNPTFETIRPHVEFLNIGGQHMGVDTSRNSESAIDAPERSRRKEQTEIALGELQGLMTKHHPGQTADEKKKKIDLLERCFGRRSWEAVSAMPLEEIQKGFDTMHVILEGRPYYSASGVDERPIPYSGSQPAAPVDSDGVPIQ